MNIKLFLFICSSLIGGIIITLITGLFNYPNQGLIGAEKWGLPFFWLSQVIYPGSSKIIHWSNLFMDILIWGSLIFITIYLIDILISRYWHKKSNKKIEKLIN